MTIKRIYIIGGGAVSETIDATFGQIETDFFAGKIKNQTYELMITKGFIDKYGKDNVINCRVRGTGEYKNILWYKGYKGKHFNLFKEIWQHRKESIIMFHGVYPWILIYSLIPAKHKCRWRHGMIGEYKFSENKIKWILCIIVQRFFQMFINTIFYVNETEKKELTKYGFKGNKFFLPIPINTDFWKDINNSRGIHNSTINISCAGGYWYLKNQKIIIDAISLLNEQRRKDFQINFCGYNTDINYKNSLKKIAKKNNINVTFNGLLSASQLKELYKNTDIYIQPSFREGLCQTYIETCLSGCPLILSNIPTFTETAKDCALFFDPLDAKDLSEKILYMLDHLDEYRMKSKKLAKDFEKFGYDSFNKQLDNFISTIVEKGN